MTTLVRITSIAFLVFLSAAVSSAQKEVDVRVQIELANDTARGGEPFSFTAKITNTGAKEATDVIVLGEDSHNGQARFDITSAISQRGDCELGGRPSISLGGQPPDRTWRCRIGTLAPGETVTVNFGGKLGHYDEGDETISGVPNVFINTINKTPLEPRPPAAQPSEPREYPEVEIATVSAMPDVPENDTDNNHAGVIVHLMPSSNRAPIVAITSPNNDSLLTRPARKSTSFEFKIEASDPDGTIEKILVHDPKYSPTPFLAEGGGWKFLYLGKEYTGADLDAFMRSNPPPERLAQRTGKNTFVYKLTDPAWGSNQLSVEAHDNGGRAASKSINFVVKGDSTVEIVSPKKDQIIAPGSTLVIEALARVNEGPVKAFILDSEPRRTPDGAPPQMELVSKQGNVYRYRHLWKNVPESNVFSSVRVLLIEESGAMTESDGVSFLPRNISKINFTSVRDGQVFTNAKTIDIRFDVTDKNWDDMYSIYIDGKHESTVFTGFIWHNPKLGPHTVQVVAKFSDIEVGRSELLTIYVK